MALMLKRQTPWYACADLHSCIVWGLKVLQTRSGLVVFLSVAAASFSPFAHYVHIIASKEQQCWAYGVPLSL